MADYDITNPNSSVPEDVILAGSKESGQPDDMRRHGHSRSWPNKKLAALPITDSAAQVSGGRSCRVTFHYRG